MPSCPQPPPLAPCLQYKLNVRRQVRGKAERALAALREVQPDAAHLSVERDILPKLEVRAGTALHGLQPVYRFAMC